MVVLVLPCLTAVKVRRGAGKMFVHIWITPSMVLNMDLELIVEHVEEVQLVIFADSIIKNLILQLGLTSYTNWKIPHDKTNLKRLADLD